MKNYFLGGRCVGIEGQGRHTPSKRRRLKGTGGLTGAVSPVHRGSRRGLPGSRKGKIGPFFNPEGRSKDTDEVDWQLSPCSPQFRAGAARRQDGHDWNLFQPGGGPKDTGGVGRRRLPVHRSSERELPGGREDEIGPFFQRFGSLPPYQTPLRKIPHHFKARLSRQLRRPPRSHRVATPALCLGQPPAPSAPPRRLTPPSTAPGVGSTYGYSSQEGSPRFFCVAWPDRPTAAHLQEERHFPALSLLPVL